MNKEWDEICPEEFSSLHNESTRATKDWGFWQDPDFITAIEISYLDSLAISCHKVLIYRIVYPLYLRGIIERLRRNPDWHDTDSGALSHLFVEGTVINGAV